MDDNRPVEGIYAFILHKVEIWKGVTHASLTDWLTDNFER